MEDDDSFTSGVAGVGVVHNAEEVLAASAGTPNRTNVTTTRGGAAARAPAVARRNSNGSSSSSHELEEMNIIA